MEWNELVNEIADRVKKKLEEQSSLECKTPLKVCEPKKRLLIISPEHSETCHELWDSMDSNSKWSIECALEKNYDCDASAADVVVLRQISNEVLVKIATGIGDTPLTTLAIQAILMGKRVLIPTEELELLSYKNTAPTAYYDHMLQYVALLKRAGVQLCDKENLYAAICDNEICENKPYKNSEKPLIYDNGQEKMHIKKRVITERDIHDAHANKITQLWIGKKAIITDLAKDYARERGITFAVQQD